MNSIPSDDSARKLTPKTTYIYALVDPRDNAVRYIGKANNPRRRLREHINRPEDSHKGRWINIILGLNIKPSMIILEEVSYENWQVREIYWIEFYRSQGHNLTNILDGGEGAELPLESRAKLSAKMKGRKKSPETIARMSAAQRGRTVSPEARTNMSASRKGKQLSPLARANAAAANRGKKRPPEVVERYASSHRGKKHHPLTDEHKQAISEYQSGQTRSPEMRAKVSAAHKGRVHTPEARANMSLGRKRAKAMRENPPDMPTLWN